MKQFIVVALTSMVLLGAGYAGGQVAGSTTVGVAVEEMKAVVLGWSAKKQILGKIVYNEKDEKVGKVDDIIIAPNKTVSYLIIGAGGFVGMGKHNVAIPMSQIQDQNGKIVLPGAAKEIVKALPPFEYAKNKK
jgi:sporulation protein YlmC with PRC-barrel domain